jgi:hypothetical protein
MKYDDITHRDDSNNVDFAVKPPYQHDWQGDHHQMCNLMNDELMGYVGFLIGSIDYYWLFPLYDIIIQPDSVSFLCMWLCPEMGLVLNQRIWRNQLVGLGQKIICTVNWRDM